MITHGATDWNDFYPENDAEFRVVEGKLKSPFQRSTQLLAIRDADLYGYWRFGQLQSFEDQSGNGNTAIGVSGTVDNPAFIELEEDGAPSTATGRFAVVVPGLDPGFDALPITIGLWFRAEATVTGGGANRSFSLLAFAEGGNAAEFEFVTTITAGDWETDLRYNQDDVFGLVAAGGGEVTTIGKDWQHPTDDEWHHIMLQVVPNQQLVGASGMNIDLYIDVPDVQAGVL
jgi:hypothetical protein